MPRGRPFVGRSDEVRVLADLLSDAAHGQGCVVLVQGAAGVGKTRLVEETLAGVGSNVRVGRGYAADEHGTPPLWPWTRACSAAGLRTVLAAMSEPPDIDRATEAEVVAERLRWMTAVADRLVAEAATEPVLLVLEDLHWADSASLELLRNVAPLVPTAGLAVVATSRVGAPHVESAFGLARRFPGTHELRVGPLSVDEVGAYLAGTGVSPSTAPRVHRDSGGLPLLLTAAPPGQGSATPYDVRSIALAMLTQAGAAARPVLETAAVLGEDVDARLLAQVAGVASQAIASALEAGIRTGLLDESGDRFTHALLRDGLTAALAPDRRRDLHRRSGLELARRGTAAARAAVHLRLAGHDPEVLDARERVSREAAADAVRSLAYDDAVRFLADVEETVVARGCDAVTVAEARLALASAQYLDGRPMDALGLCQQVSAAAVGTGRPHLVAEAALVVRGVSFPQADEAVIALAKAALREEGQPGSVRSRLLAQVVAAEAGAGRPDRVESLAAESWALAQGTVDPDTFLDAARARESTLVGPDDDVERLRIAEAAAACASRLGRTVPTVLAHGWRVRAGYAMARLDVAHDGLDQLTSLSARTGLLLAHWHLARAVAARATLEGRFDAAAAANAEAAELAARSADPAGAGLTTALSAHLALLRGDPAALPSLEEFRHAPDIPLGHLMRSACHLLAGDRTAAEAEYRRLRRLLWEPGVDLRWGGVVLRMIDVVEAFDDREAADELATQLRPWAGVPGTPGIHTAFFERVPAGQLGRALVVAGRARAAEPLLRKAVDAHRSLGAAPYVVLAELDLADLLAPDRHREARSLATAAAARARTMDMPGSVARADKLLRDLAHADRSRDPLSPREREIASLVVAARSNRQVAEQLFISERTVETHVRSILGKVGCVNRTELIARRDELGL